MQGPASSPQDEPARLGAEEINRPPTRGGASRSHLFVWAGVAAVTVILVGAGIGLYESQTAGTQCSLGPALGVYLIQTPFLLGNFPLGGGVSDFESTVNWTFESGSVLLEPLRNSGDANQEGFGGGYNGSGILASFEPRNWTIYSVSNVSGPTDGVPCTQPYVAVSTPAPFGQATFQLPIANNSSDAVEPHYVNESGTTYDGLTFAPNASVWFDTSFHAGPPNYPNETALNLCGWNTPFIDSARGIVSVPIAVSVLFQGRLITSYGNLTWAGYGSGNPAATYAIPPGWIWDIAQVGTSSYPGPSFLPTGLLAFERFPC